MNDTQDDVVEALRIVRRLKTLLNVEGYAAKPHAMFAILDDQLYRLSKICAALGRADAHSALVVAEGLRSAKITSGGDLHHLMDVTHTNDFNELVTWVEAAATPEKDAGVPVR